MVSSQTQYVVRILYSLLINELSRDPVEAITIVALWTWLYQCGLHHTIGKIVTLPLPLLNGISDEAAACISFLHGTAPLSNLTLTQRFIGQKLTVHFFHEHRVNALFGIGEALKGSYLMSLSDLLESAMRRNSQPIMPPMPIPIPMPMPMPIPMPSSDQVGPSQPRPRSQSRSQSVTVYAGESSRSRSQIRRESGVPPELRSMFVTFSRGYPVAEEELRNFFFRLLGDCIESCYMDPVTANNEQALFARIAFRDQATVEMILNGRHKAKFAINGKHVWMRKFVPR